MDNEKHKTKLGVPRNDFAFVSENLHFEIELGGIFGPGK